MTLRLPDDLNEQVKQQADTEHLSMQQVVVKATREYLARHDKQARIIEAVDGIKLDYAEALRRLGE